MITVSEEEFREALDDSGGWCKVCHEYTTGVEPDARKYECPSCGAREVYGAEELLIMGDLTFED